MSTLLRTTRIVCCLSATALAACVKSESASGDSAAASSTSSSTTQAPAPAPVNLADVAGEWNMRAVPTSGDATATNYVMTA
jgi:hypothetical protein